MLDNKLPILKTSKKYSIDLRDFFKSLLSSLYAAIIAACGQVLEPWFNNPTSSLPFTKINLILTAKIAFAMFFGEMWRRYLKPSTNILLSEKK